MSAVVIPLSSRQLPSIIAGFLEYTDGLQSPEIFRKWSAIAMIAGALERKVWIRSQGRPLYPNLYTFLVGPPGAGKSNAMHVCEHFWRELPGQHVAPVSLTKAALIDMLAKSERNVMRPALNPPHLTFHSLKIAAGELGALIPGYDSDFLNALTYIYDCKMYDEHRRTGDKHIEIKAPQINLIANTTPGFLAESMPPGAWEQGFLSRTIIVYSEPAGHVPLDLMEERVQFDKRLEAAVLKDVLDAGEAYGRMMFSPAAAELLERWNATKDSTAPKHPRLINYNIRRVAHLLKLSMVAAADRGSMLIDVEDYQAALGWLTEAEYFMPDVFKAMRSGGDATVIDECWHMVLGLWTRKQQPTPESIVLTFLYERLPVHAVEKVMMTMVRVGLLKATTTAAGTAYIPKGKS